MHRILSLFTRQNNKGICLIFLLLAAGILIYLTVWILPISCGKDTAYLISSISKVNRSTAVLHSESSKDVTSLLEDLGIPFNKKGFARNIWDMQVFDGRIYLGHGNCSNSGPNPNAGPIRVIYYSPSENRFITQFTVDEEQIDMYKEMNGKLYIPGYDSRESWKLGNFYKLEKDKWTKVRTIPNGVHVFDLALYKGKLYAATGSTSVSPTVYSSSDGGRTWKPVVAAGRDPYYAMIGRTYNLLKFKDKLYAIPLLYNQASKDKYNRIMVIDTKCTTTAVSKDSMFPGAPLYALRLIRWETALNKLVYIAGKYDQWVPEGLYCASEINKARRITLPDAKVLPFDILVLGNLVYVLTSKMTATGKYINVVYKTSDFVKWNELFSFQYDTFARSFEELDSDFYFGMGCFQDSVSQSTGRVLKLDGDKYR